MTWRYAPLLCAGLLVVSTSSAAAQDAASDPPAHISFADGAAVLERDGRLDSTPSNMPLLAGDRVRTQGGRVEILFADGSTLHLDANTTVDFQSDELVRLIDGRIRLSIPGPNRAVSYRIDAPSASAQINEPGEYRVAVLRGDRDPEVELAVLRGAADLVNEDGRTALRAGERGFARANTAPSIAYVFNSAAWDAFDRWSEARRDERRGISTQYLPDQVRPYSAAFDRYGSWRYESSHGYVWYPTVTTGWRPYYNGRWVTLRPYGWTWVGSDPWAWATHHYGRWGISAGVWFWIPGRSWAPAWVSWAYAPGYVSWCPLGWNNRPVVQIAYRGRYDPWRAWTVVPRPHFGGRFVNARGIAGSRFDARAFVSRNSAPEVAGQAIPRASAPIRVAGTGGGRRVPSPVYTNLEPGASRVGGTAPRVIVGQPRGTSAAVPRTAPMNPDSRAGTAAEPRSRGAAGVRVPSGADTRSTPRDNRYDARGRYDAQGRSDAPGRYATPERSPSSRAIPREDPVYRSMPYPSQRMPYPSQRAPEQTPARDAPVRARPGPRPDDGSTPGYRRDSYERRPAPGEPDRGAGQRVTPRSSPEGSRPAPQESRPSPAPPAGFRNAPSQERPSGPPPGASRSRSGGQSSSGTAVRRPGGGKN